MLRIVNEPEPWEVESHCGIVTGLKALLTHLCAARRSASLQLALLFIVYAGIALAQQAQTSPPATPARPARRIAGGGLKNYDPAAVARGQKIFSATCSFCHGANAKGGETGPDLLRSVVVLDDDHGEKIGQVVLNGRPDKGMPKFSLSQQQIQDIATFLHQRVKDAALRGTYQILNIVDGDPKAGEAYFNGAGRCNTCHSVTGDLAHIGSKFDPVAIQQKIVMPRERRPWFMPSAPGPPSNPVIATVTLSNGQSVSGKLDHIDDFNVSLIDSSGDYHSFTRRGDTPKVELKDPFEAHTEMLMKYTDADIHNLTAYLVSLK
jgi:cytochrome c oxidase cbb3-type subunit 3